jgi:hypothetical protein
MFSIKNHSTREGDHRITPRPPKLKHEFKKHPPLQMLARLSAEGLPTLVFFPKIESKRKETPSPRSAAPSRFSVLYAKSLPTMAKLVGPLTGIGSSLVTWNTNHVVSMLFLATTALATASAFLGGKSYQSTDVERKTEARERLLSDSAVLYRGKISTYPKDLVTDLLIAVKSRLMAKSVQHTAESLWLAVGIVQECSQRNYVRAFAFLINACGILKEKGLIDVDSVITPIGPKLSTKAVAPLIDRVQQTIRNTRERSTFLNTLSNRLGAVFNDLAAYYPIGNLMLNVGIVPWRQLNTTDPSTIVGCVLMCGGSAVALKMGAWPAYKNLFYDSNPHSPVSDPSKNIMYAGLGDIIVGTGTLFLAGSATGAGSIVWGVANIFLGLKIRLDGNGTNSITATQQS